MRVKGTGNLTLTSTSGDLSVNSGGVSAGTGNVLLQAGVGAVGLQVALSVGVGNVNVVAGKAFTQGVDGDINITGPGSLDVRAGTITMADGATSTIANGNIAYTTVGALTLGITGAGVRLGQEALRITGAGNLALTTTAGDVNVESGGASVGRGNISLQASMGAVDLQAPLAVGAGNVTVVAAKTFTQGVDGDIYTAGGGSLDVRAGTITMADGASGTTTNGNIRYAAVGKLTLGALSSNANVSLSALNVVDAGAGDTDTLNITAFGLDVVITGSSAGDGFGSVDNAIETNVAQLSGSVASAGGLVIAQSNSITLGTLSSTGNLIVSTQAGGITTLAGAAITVAGDLLLNAGGSDSDIKLGADLKNTKGNISLFASGSIVQSANITSTAPGKTVEMEAVTGTVKMADGTLLRTEGGNVRVKASGSITLGQIDTRLGLVRAPGTAGQEAWGLVSLLTPNGSIVDNATEAGNGIDVYAKALRIEAALGAGEGANHIESEIITLSASVGLDGVFLTDATSLTVGQTQEVVTQRVANDATNSVSATTDPVQSDVASAGAVVLRTLAGNLTIAASQSDTSGAVRAGGNLLLQAGADTANGDSDILLNAIVRSASGNISVNASRSILQNANVWTGGNASTIDFQAGSNIQQSQDTETSTVSITSNNGNVNLFAGGSITLETVAAGSGSVRMVAGGSIVDGDAQADVQVDLTATGLQMVAGLGGGVGQASNPLEVSVGVIAARAGRGGVYVLETDAISVDAVNVSVQRVDFGANTTVQGFLLDDLRTSEAGNIVLVARDGGILLSDGLGSTLLDNTAVLADGGNVLLDAQGPNSDLVATAYVSSKSGDITMRAGRELLLGTGTTPANVTTSGTGTIELLATRGSVTMLGTSGVGAAGSSVRLAAGGNVVLGNVSATFASIKADAGSISSAAASTTNVTSLMLRLEAGQSIGTEDRKLTTAVVAMSALARGAGQSGIYISDIDDVSGTSVGVSVQEVTVTGETVPVDDAVQSDLTSTGNGNIVLLSQRGSVTLQDGDANGTAMSAGGSGNILVQTLVNSGNITVNGDVVSGNGQITLLSGGSTTFAPNADVRTDASVTIKASTGDVLMSKSTIAGGSGVITVNAGGKIVVGVVESTAPISIDASGRNEVAFGTATSWTGQAFTGASQNVEITIAAANLDRGAGSIAERLQRAYLLGSPGEQPLISGLSTFSQDSFEYWVNTLSL
jgi:hypothetical protein